MRNTIKKDEYHENKEYIIFCIIFVVTFHTNVFSEERVDYTAICSVGLKQNLGDNFKNRLNKMNSGDKFSILSTGDTLIIDKEYVKKIDPSYNNYIVMKLFATDSTKNGFIPRCAHSNGNDGLIFNVVQKDKDKVGIIATAWNPKIQQKLASTTVFLDCKILPLK